MTTYGSSTELDPANRFCTCCGKELTGHCCDECGEPTVEYVRADLIDGLADLHDTPMAKRMQYCAFCGEQIGVFESWGEPESCGKVECDREIRYMLQSEEAERRERAEQDHYDRY